MVYPCIFSYGIRFSDDVAVFFYPVQEMLAQVTEVLANPLQLLVQRQERMVQVMVASPRVEGLVTSPPVEG